MGLLFMTLGVVLFVTGAVFLVFPKARMNLSTLGYVAVASGIIAGLVSFVLSFYYTAMLGVALLAIGIAILAFRRGRPAR